MSIRKIIKISHLLIAIVCMMLTFGTLGAYDSDMIGFVQCMLGGGFWMVLTFINGWLWSRM